MFEFPGKVEDDFVPDDPLPDDNLDPFDRTMIAYCVAYKVNPTSIRYRVDEGDHVEDAPRFQLIDSDVSSPVQYDELQLLAVFRSLRFNELYGTMSFAGINLNCLNARRDPYGSEHCCHQSVHGLPLKLPLEEQQTASLLVQEIRALALSTRKLRRLDFSFCISHYPATPGTPGPMTIPGSGIFEALFPLCKQQATNVDWIAVNGIELQETDLDYLVSIAAEKAAHYRAVEASRCTLTDRGLALLLDVFKAHENTLEALDISKNPLRIVPSTLSSQLSFFGHIRKLNLSNLSVTATADPLIPFEVLSQWRLDTLHLSSIHLNEQTLQVLCKYVGLIQSLTLRELWLCNCGLTGEDAANLMQSMIIEEGAARFCHTNISENPLCSKPDKFISALAQSLSPTQLSLRSIEYDIEEVFENLLLALASNKSTRTLDIARTSLPAEASEAVCKALETLLADNQTLINLDISGEETRLEISKLGVGINQALNGLKKNRNLQVLRVQYQKLGIQGASTLAEVLQENSTLRELHCDFNAITLAGFTDLVNSLAGNKAILFLPPFTESREAAVRQTEDQIRIARTKTDSSSALSSTTSKISSVRRTFTSLSASAMPSSSAIRTSSKVGAVPQWTEQDIQAALRIVTEGWELQASRLNEYLARNWRILHGMSEPGEGAASAKSETSIETQRPGTAGSLGRVLEKVAAESTPTREEDLQLGDAMLGAREPHPANAESSANDSDVAPGLDAASFTTALEGARESGALESPASPRATFGDLPIDNAHFMKENIFQPGSPTTPTTPTTPDAKRGGLRRSVESARLRSRSGTGSGSVGGGRGRARRTPPRPGGGGGGGRPPPPRDVSASGVGVGHGHSTGVSGVVLSRIANLR